MSLLNPRDLSSIYVWPADDTKLLMKQLSLTFEMNKLLMPLMESAMHCTCNGTLRQSHNFMLLFTSTQKKFGGK